MFKGFEIWAITMALGYLKKDGAQIEELLQPYIKQGETDIVALAYKVNDLLGLLVQEAVKVLGPQLPKYEGDAVAWLEATLQAWLQQLEG